MQLSNRTKHKLALAGAAILASAFTQAGFAATSVSYSTAGSTYAPDFTTLPSSTTTATIGVGPASAASPSLSSVFTTAGFSAPGSSFNGWYAYASGGSSADQKAGVGEPSTTTGALFSFSSSSTNQALGAISTSSTGLEYFGVEIVNNTGGTLNQVAISFNDNLWWQGSLKPLDFGYAVDTATNAGTDTLGGIVTAGLTSDANLKSTSSGATIITGTSGDFTAGGANPSGAVSTPSDTESLSDTITLTNGLTNGEALWLVWSTDTDTSKSQGIGINNLSVSLTSSAVPEPASASLLLLVSGGLLARRRRQAK